MNTLFKTIHGSNLYGLAHSESDLDYYVVIEPVKREKKTYSVQTIVDGIDTTVVDLGTWLQHCYIGVPQALEAMFAPPVKNDRVQALRSFYRAGTEARDRFETTMVNFAEKDTYKSKRHAMRLAFELRGLMECGRFNPVLRLNQADFITKAAFADVDKVLEYSFKIAYS